MKRENKKYIVILLMITMLSLTYGIKYLRKNKYEELPEVKLVKLKEKIEKEKTFAIMISDDGSNYKKYESNEWPNDKYKFKEAKCLDNNGNLVDNAASFESGKATITTDKTIYCTLYFDHKKTIEILRENDTNKNLSPESNQGGMYRYQGTDDVANWICFGTNDLSKCTDITDSDGNSIPDGIDKYMYRIIGINPNGELYLLKETFVKEGETIGFAWNSKGTLPDCLGEACEWPNVDLYKRLNGTTIINGDNKDDEYNTDIFVNNKYYNYLQSGDENGTNDGIGSEWYQLIADHEWMYGDSNEASDSIRYNGNKMYAIETGKVSTKRYWPDEETQLICSVDSPCSNEDYWWSAEKSVNAKIGLMYMHDIDYAYYDGNDPDTRGNPENMANIKNSWLFFQKDGYNTSPGFEWLITRYGSGSAVTSNLQARLVSFTATIGWRSLSNYKYGVRPVFYLSSKGKIVAGDGAKNSPFIINY